MAADFNLINSAATLPMKADTFKPIDAVGNMEKAYTLAGEMVDTGEKVRKAQEDEQYRAVLKEYSSRDGTDLVTPQGLTRAMKDLQGKIPVDKFQALGQAAQKSAMADAQFREHMSKASEAEIANTAAQMDQAYPVFESLMKQHAEDKAAKGKDYADAQFRDNQQKALQALGQQKTATGQPMLSPAVLQTISQVDADHLPGVMNQMKGHKTALDARLTEARAKAQEAIAAGGRSPNALQKYDAMLKNGEISQEEYDQLKKGFLEKQGPKATGAAVDWEAQPATQGEKDAAKNFLMTERMPSMGTGAAAAAKKARILELASQEADNLGMKPEDTAQLRIRIKASQEGLKRLMTQSANIKAGEKNVVGALGVLEDEVRKLGGPDSPKLKAFMNKAYTEWKGDPDFVGINQAYLDVIENSARVYSGVTGAGGTPVSFLELAKKSLPENPSLAQVLKLKEVMPRLFAVRSKATEDEMDAVSKTATLPKAAATKDDQKARDADAGKILKDEYDKAVKELAGLTGDTLRRKREDIAALRREAKTKGVDLPEPGVTSDAPKTLTSKTGKKFTVTVE